MADRESESSYERQAEVVFNDLKETQRSARASQIEYGKWLVNTLWLMHSGSIVGLLFKAHVGGTPPPYLGAIWWFVAGIVFAFGAGFSAWWNFTFSTLYFHKLADYRMLSAREFWPKPERSRHMLATMWVAIACGVLSLVCLLGGTWAVWHSWKM